MPILAAGDTYTVNNLAWTNAAAVTIIQIKSVTVFWLVRAALTQKGSTTSAQERVQILKLTTASTVTSTTPLKLDSSSAASAQVGGTAATGIIGTAEGGVGDVLVDRGFNVLNGFEWIPTPVEYIQVNVGEFIALKFPVAPASQVWSAQLVYCE